MRSFSTLFFLATVVLGSTCNTSFGGYILTVNVNQPGQGTVVSTPGPINTNGITGVNSGEFDEYDSLLSNAVVLTATGKSLTVTHGNVQITEGQSLSLSATGVASYKVKDWQVVANSGSFTSLTPPTTEQTSISIQNNSATDPVNATVNFEVRESVFQYAYDLDGLGGYDFVTNSPTATLSYATLQGFGLGVGSYAAKVRVQGTTNGLTGSGNFSNDFQFSFDILPTSAVPEPSSFILFSVVAGAGAVGRRFWKKRRAAC